MIDRESRNLLAESTRHYFSCLIDNFQFDKNNFTIISNDEGVNSIKASLWGLYDDIRRHKNEGKHKMPESDEIIAKRIILFLKTDVEYQWMTTSFRNEVRLYLKKIFKLDYKKELLYKENNSKGDINYWPFFFEV